MQGRIAIGGGAGFAGDRPEAAGVLAAALAAGGVPAYLVLELLAERTLAEAQLARLRGGAGFSTRLIEFVAAVAGPCLAAGIPIVTNGGAADPVGAAEAVRRELGAAGAGGACRIACVTGDDLLEADGGDTALLEALRAGGPGELVSANVYLGALPVAEALAAGAGIVIAGRVADPSLAVACARHGLGWSPEDADQMATATLAGHLIECGAQATGGYFADPGAKDVPGPEDPGLPIATLDRAGGLAITKPAGTGGAVTARTIKEQLLYEVHDPAAYLTPDVTLDLTGVTLAERGADRVELSGARGRPRPETLKGIAGYLDGWSGEAGISYAGPNAAARALLAAEILRSRLPRHAPTERRRIDVIGVASLFNDEAGEVLAAAAPQARGEDCRVMLAVADRDRARVEHALRELESLYTNGPAGGGGVRRAVTERLATRAFAVPRAAVRPAVRLL